MRCVCLLSYLQVTVLTSVPAEIAIVSTDLAELLGSAIALNLLIPAIPLWVGVILTSLDVLLVLVMTDGNKTRPARMFEAIIVLLVG